MDILYTLWEESNIDDLDDQEIKDFVEDCCIDLVNSMDYMPLKKYYKLLNGLKDTVCTLLKIK